MVVGLGVGAGTASAHGTAPSGVVSVAQTLGDREMTVTLALPPGGTGVLPIRIAARGRAPDGMLRVRTVPDAGPGAGAATSEALVRSGASSRSAAASLALDRVGPWEIVVEDGSAQARIPLLVPATAVPAWVWAVRGGLALTVTGVIAAAGLARRRPRWAAALGGVAVVGVAVAVTAALLPAGEPAADPPAADSPAASGMHAGHGGMGAGPASPPGPVVMAVTPVASTGGAVELGIDLHDGSTGAVVDDLAIHDEALIHLVVAGPDRRLWHVHPVRTAPGRYTVRLSHVGRGGYGVFAELERGDGGPRLLRSAFTLPDDRAAPSPAPEGSPAAAGMRVDVSVPAPVAGRPATVTLMATEGRAPVRDLQTWLGMAGHLLILGPAPGRAPDPLDPATSFGHAHAMAGDRPSGPDVTFTYTFPRPGRYQLWAQVQRRWEVVTVPLTVDVAPETPHP